MASLSTLLSMTQRALLEAGCSNTKPKLIECNECSKEQIAIDKLVQQSQQLRSHLNQLVGTSVALATANMRRSLCLFLALDGVVKQLILVQGNMSVHELPNSVQADYFIDAAGGLHHVSEQDSVAESDSKKALQPCQSVPIQTRWGLLTSGTTGEPKLSFHTLKSLVRTTKAFKPEYTKLRWGLSYELHRLAGLQVTLQALLGGADMVDVTSADLPQKLNGFIAAGVNALSMTPSMWRQLLMHTDIGKLQLKQITLGGEIADQALLDRLAKTFKRARIVHIYALTELGVGFSVSDGKAGFPSSWLKDEALKGVNLRVTDEQLWIKTAMMDTFLPTGDGVVVDESEQRVFFLGRLSGVINVGGKKVHPESIEQVLSKVDGVQWVVAFASRNTLLGALVGIQVVASDSVDLAVLKASIQQCAKDELLPWQRPATIKFVRRVELSQAGKLARA